jgi:hypothetical protein
MRESEDMRCRGHGPHGCPMRCLGHGRRYFFVTVAVYTIEMYMQVRTLLTEWPRTCAQPEDILRSAAGAMTDH